MRYQERIYIQNDNRAVRNKDILNVNMSSDFCVFVSPKFDISGATKVQCDSIVASFSAVSFNNMLSAATQPCLSGLSSTSCYTGTTWETRIFENNAITYSADFFTTNLTGVTPSQAQFITSVSNGLSALGYIYTLSGNTFDINKKPNVQTLEVDICVSLGLNQNAFSCPVGFSATPANDGCIKITTTAATFHGIGVPIAAGNTDPSYSQFGTYFYPDIQGDGALPVFYLGSGQPLLDQSGATIVPLASATTGTFWNNVGNTTDGRLNQVGLSASSTSFVGFTYCLDIATGGTYYVGLGADNFARFKVNGDLIANFSGNVQDNFKKWSVFPLKLNSGLNIIEMQGMNAISVTSFGAEIYNPIDFATLTGATTTGSTGANVIFSTKSFVGGTFDAGDNVGYSCPPGFALNGCGTGFTCTLIETTGITSGCTSSGNCSGDCSAVLVDSFPFIDVNSQGVFVFDAATATTLDISFNFTGSTDAFTANNATFKYEIYKFNPQLNVFVVPPVFKSDVINYATFSGTNILNVSIPLTALPLDGDFVIKGYYEADTCTNFLNRLGKRIDTAIYKQSGNYQLYDESLDYYIVSLYHADKPLFTQTQVQQLAFYDALPLYQQVILVDDANEFNVTEGQGDDQIVATGNTYFRSGSTFSLVSEYVGDVIITLNGSVLAKDLDYTLSGTVLTFFGPIVDGDVITAVYTRTSTLTIIAENIDISGAIPSGTTGNEGASQYYYNTSTGKYEVFTNNIPIDFSKIVVILNGVFLVDGIDYYQSITDKSRIILAGSLMTGDIVVLVYYPTANIINGITQSSNSISWYIPNVPAVANGYFTLEVSSSPTFSTFTVNSVVPYSALVTNYDSILVISGNVGDNFYYRVRNTKNYASICGDTIKTEAFSEVVPVEIQSNAINSY
jgi:hypothetical protein